jgi:cytochrome c
MARLLPWRRTFKLAVLLEARLPAVLLAGALAATGPAWGQTASGDTPTPPARLRGDAGRGQTLYQACTSCHSLDDNDIGPKHRGVVGRPAGTVPDYAYSAALKSSGIVWDAATLDRWLTNPQALVPGTKMYFLIADPQMRADIIAYLAQQK